jgi:centromere protein C
LTIRSVNAGVTNKNAARQNGKARLAATEAADFSDGEGEGDENVDSFAAGRDDFSDGYDEGDETVMPEEPADATVQNLNGQEDEVSPAPAASRQTKTTASSLKQPKKGPAAKTTIATRPAAKPTGKRGRAPKTQQAADNDEPAEAGLAKKPKTTATATSKAPREPLDPELERVVENYAQRTGPLKGRSLYILKREDPTSSETTHTRSGRVSVRPLAYWRNERCVYGDEEATEGERFPLSKIKEVIRTEELEPEKPKKGKRSRKGKSKKQKDESSDEDEIDDDADLWEKETGVLHGYVSKWDPVAQTSTSEEEVIGMISISCLAVLFLSLLINLCRHSVRTFWLRDKGSQRRVIPLRKAAQFFIHWLRCC